MSTVSPEPERENDSDNKSESPPPDHQTKPSTPVEDQEKSSSISTIILGRLVLLVSTYRVKKRIRLRSDPLSEGIFFTPKFVHF